MTLNDAIETELRAYRAARSSGDVERAWQMLARLHILSQTQFGPHIRSHVEMLRFAIARRDVREILGQLVRLILAPLGNITGRLPLGNTGRANVSAFLPMDIPDDLQRLINEANHAN
jgi:hypothetical protein